MKKLITYLLISLALSNAKAQSNFASHWDSLFRNIKNSTAISSGYLWDLGIPDSTQTFYTGKRTDSLSTYEHWSNIYQYWINSSASAGHTIIPYDTAIQQFNAFFKNGITVIPVLYASGESINSDAYEKKKIVFDSSTAAFRIVDPTGLFKNVKTFIAAPFVEVFYAEKARFLISDKFYYNNTGSQIIQVQYSLNGAPFLPIEKNVPFEVLLADDINHVEFRFALSNGEILFCVTELLLAPAPVGMHPGSGPFHMGDARGNIYSIPLRTTEFIEPLGAYIDYLPGINNGVPNTCIMKPILIVEGIDFGYKNHPTGCYGGKCGYLGLRDMVDGKVYNPYETNSKKRYEDWDAIVKAPDFISALRNKGYDIYYIDFHNGADYMENNAMLVVEFIQQLNNMKCSNEELVIMGASMGGIITRYALNYMEKNNIPHCVRTFVSFDAPQQGANIPLGIQYTMKYFRGKLPLVKDNYDRKINRAASRQLLVYHSESGAEAEPHKDRNDFLKGMSKLGNYPLLTRNIAVSNGNLAKKDQGFNPGDILLEMNPYFGRLNAFFLQIYAKVFANYYSSFEAGQVMEARFPLKKELRQSVPYSTDKCDHIPGSKRYDLQEARAIYIVFNVVTYETSSCFVPTISSLDIKSEDLFYNVNLKLNHNNPDPALCPFAAITGPGDINEEHMKITDGNINWMISEIEKNAGELPMVLHSRYNFGLPARKALKSVSIAEHGVLQVNGQYLTGFGKSAFDVNPVAGSDFEVFSNDCAPVITIEDGGAMILGDNNGKNNNTGIVRIRKGAVIYIKKGGLLKLYNRSHLIIETGATLIYAEGARIVLDGMDAQLQIDGVLRIEKDAVFTIEKGNEARCGFIKFRNMRGGYGNARIELGGSNSAVKLTGADPGNLLMQLEGEISFVQIHSANKLSRFEAYNGLIVYGNHSRLILNSETILIHVTFEKLYWATAFSSDALVLNNCPKVEIESCFFTDLKYGIKHFGSKDHAPVKLEGSRFSNCSVGIYFEGKSLNAEGLLFTNCKEYGADILNPSSDIIFKNSFFRFNERALRIQNTENNMVSCLIDNCDVSNNVMGAELAKCNTVITCSRFLANGTACSVLNGELNISTNKNTSGYGFSSYGGNNTFAYNNIAGIKTSNVLIFMDKGKNNFIQFTGINSFNFIMGDIVYSTMTHQSNSPYALIASDNYWYPAPPNGLSSGAMTHYFVKFPYPGGGLTLNYFTGDLLGKVNTTCYYLQGCNPCDLVSGDENSKKLVGGPVNNMRISPFPVDNRMQIEMDFQDTISITEIRLMGIDGKLVYAYKGKEVHLTVETGDFPNGIYILELKWGENIELRKIIINH